jgi:uncharacterized protein YkwD
MICQQRQRFLLGLKTIPEEEEVVQFLADDEPSQEQIQGDKEHNVVNQSRIQHNLQPLHRTAALDAVAYAHAQCMAQRQAVYHSVNSVLALQKRLGSKHVGENVQRGISITHIHRDSMLQKDSFIRRNILSTSFDEMGMSTFIGTDGIMYLCQVFRSSK